MRVRRRAAGGPRSRFACVVLAVAVLAGACSHGGRSSNAVATRVQTFVDRTRPTPANRGHKGSPTRTLRVRFYYPKPGTAGAPFPLILFSPGVSVEPEVYKPLLVSIASAGFVVAAVAYPLTKQSAPGGASPFDVAEQPKDASFVLDRVLAANAAKTGWLHGLVDKDRIGAAGHSLGAMTTYGLVYNRCCLDPRIKAAAVLAGATVVLPGQTYTFPADRFFTGITTPLLAISGDHDEIVPYRTAVGSFNAARGPKFLVTVVDGTHTSDEEGGGNPGQRAVTQAVIDFFDGYLRDQGHARTSLRDISETYPQVTIQSEP